MLTVHEEAAANGIYRWKVSYKAPEAVKADKNALQAAIKSASSKVKSDYTTASWNTMQTALTEAKKVFDNANATQSEVDAAANKLNTAVKNLVKAVVKPGTPSSVAAKWTGKKNISITWKKAANADKYVVYRSYKKSSGYKKVASLKAGKAKTVKKTFKNMKKGTYYFKVKAYKTSGKKKIYTDYSTVVKVKVK